ncbi:MAG: hypothetical protein KAW17_01015 [Candidatus Eisenbacteria sp.]|nr:hypothetical protein [Candidatus Eisenbacteria bacterium]
MTLDEWVDQHRGDLRPDSPRPETIHVLLEVADRELRDAESVWSDDGRLEHAFASCLAAASAALAACGYRVRKGAPSHHYRRLESLVYTLGLSLNDVQELQEFRKKRSRSMYEQVGVVTRTEADAAVTAARRLRREVSAWLAREHPELTET